MRKVILILALMLILPAIVSANLVAEPTVPSSILPGSYFPLTVKITNTDTSINDVHLELNLPRYLSVDNDEREINSLNPGQSVTLQWSIKVKSDAPTGYDTLSIGAIEFYFSSKSTIYQQQQSSDNIIKIIPESVPESFDVKDIQHLTTMRIAVKSEVVEDYRNRRGQRDALLRAIIATFPSIKSSKTMEFNLKFVQDGNDEAINYFNEFYSNFVSELDEEIQRAIQNFKIVYESKSLNRSKSVNFKRSPKSFYERSADRKSEIKPFEDIKDTLVWYKSN